MEIYLEVTEQNIYELIDLGFKVEVDDEMTCELDYDINSKDSSVGLFEDWAQIISVTCEGKDMSSFFCDDDLSEWADQDIDNSRVEA